ncbi:hypothetical protein OKA05_17850 [Luteolibacter arcticus]|uniref:PEP-CTERM protein-sorting domain-containing protein n=1 Tax=Luteolibacter arcticus TaxID=1581411 RepID=A0ABT3GLN7_9BACT|nr:LamG-like jellyroll fold domain-containing protein [Luteolibacter arcticus]MCW1924435.1 hypothetical protein [Luteolibacter arcticus]
MKPTILPSLLCLAVGTATAPAAVTLFAEYHLGENGSLGANNLPLDSAGTPQDFTGQISGGTTTVGTTGVFAPDSTHYLITSGATNEGWHSANFVTLPTNDFAFGVYARASSLAAANQGDVFTLGSASNSPAGSGAFKISLASNGWAASVNGVAWVGGTNGVAGSFTADQWVHLAVVRSGGTATFYIDGVAQTGTSSATPVNGAAHLSVNPGGLTFFDGHLDEARVVTFDSGESTTVILNALQAVPEPSGVLLGGLAFLTLLRRRR